MYGFTDFKKHLRGCEYNVMGDQAEVQYQCKSSLAKAFEKLNNKALSVVQMNKSSEEWFRTAVGGRQGYLLEQIIRLLYMGITWFSQCIYAI